jgi:hypothetical protein
MEILTKKYISLYLEKISNLKNDISSFKESSKNINLNFLTESSSVFSSNIE